MHSNLHIPHVIVATVYKLKINQDGIGHGREHASVVLYNNIDYLLCILFCDIQCLLYDLLYDKPCLLCAVFLDKHCL